MNKNKFIGTWKLISFEIRMPNGSKEYPYGKHPVGTIMYQSDGYMSALIMDSNRKKLDIDISIKKDHWKKVDQQMKAAAFETFISYAGPFEVIDEQKIIHYLSVCSIPDWVGTRQERQYLFSDNTLTLSTKNKDTTAILIWEHL